MNCFFTPGMAIVSLLMCSCSKSDKIQIRDGKELLATIEMLPAHEFLAEYDRRITLHSKVDSRTLPLPKDTGGDLPIVVTRHSDAQTDFLKFRGGVFLLVFDLRSQRYAEGSDSPDDEIYTGVFRGAALPSEVSEWTIGRDHKVTKTR